MRRFSQVVDAWVAWKYVGRLTAHSATYANEPSIMEILSLSLSVLCWARWYRFRPADAADARSNLLRIPPIQWWWLESKCLQLPEFGCSKSTWKKVPSSDLIWYYELWEFFQQSSFFKKVNWWLFLAGIIQFVWYGYAGRPTGRLLVTGFIDVNS